MLEVQKFLQTNSLEDLSESLGIKIQQHESLPLIILNYDQIDSPKTNPVVRECRGLVLKSDTYEVIAKSFNRFFNWGEVQDEMQLFDFSDFSVQSKEDGSLVLIYYFDGEWHANTRASFAECKMPCHPFTWREAIASSMGLSSINDLDVALSKEFTYVCEFCSPYNKIVRRYSKPVLYLLTIIDTRNNLELSQQQCNEFASAAGMIRPEVYNFSKIEEIQEFLSQKAKDDPTFEGVVIQDRSGLRYKIKSPTYLGLHALRGNDNIYNPKHLIPFVLSGEEDELLTYFPEVKSVFYEVKSKILQEYADLIETWADTRMIEEQKDFALAIKGKPFSGVLFSARAAKGNSKEVKRIWRNSGCQIFKTLFKRKKNDTK